MIFFPAFKDIPFIITQANLTSKNDTLGILLYNKSYYCEERSKDITYSVCVGRSSGRRSPSSLTS